VRYNKGVRTLFSQKGDRKMKKELPIVFSADDNYLPFLDVAITSLIENASRDFCYRIIILHTGIKDEYAELVRKKECHGFRIDFIDISDRLEKIKSRLRDVYHFSLVTYYRLFIASLFPEYDKIIYLDSDVVVLGDVSELYRVDMGDNIIAAAPEQFVQNTEQFRTYASMALGVDPDGYVNAGVLVINLAQYRRFGIEDRFISLISKYDFDLLDPDQAYLNYLCAGRIHILPNGWNKEPMPPPCDGKKNIVHYALYKKPWQYDDVADGEYFWHYAERSVFFSEIKDRKAAFTDADRARCEGTAREILVHALKIAESDMTFAKMLTEND
jgi:lipopolysaccharide biosynthesis glycosyltransferase